MTPDAPAPDAPAPDAPAPSVTQPEPPDLAPVRTGPGSRRAAWLRAGCVVLVTLIYLCWWSSYAVNGLVAYGRYQQLEPGQPTAVMGAEFRLLSLVQTDELINQTTGQGVAPAPNAVWVVARVEVVRKTPEDHLFCDLRVLGPDRRVWEKDDSYVSRDLSGFCDEKSAPLGQPFPVEVVFQIPTRYVDQLAGVTVADASSRDARLVLAPPG